MGICAAALAKTEEEAKMKYKSSLLAKACLCAILTTAAQAETPNLTGVQHIELAVSQADAAKKWYQTHLPCEAVAQRPQRLNCGGMRIEFVARQSLGGSQGTAINHIGFAYPDVAQKMQSLENVGVGGAGVRLQRFEDGSLYRNDPGVGLHGFIFDPWGTRIELVQSGDTPTFHHIHLHTADPSMLKAWYMDNLGATATDQGIMLAGVEFHISINAEGRPAGTTERAIDHIALAASDIENLSAHLQAQGVAVYGPDVPDNARGGAKRALIAGPDGARLAIVEAEWDGFEAQQDEQIARVEQREPFAVPYTPWGEPDIQGMWTGNAAHGIPLERPADIDGDTLTADQAAERREQGTLRSIWGYEREWRDTTLGYDKFSASQQVAMIIDPPDGRLPPLTEAGRKALEDEALRRQTRLTAAGPEELSTWVRCITRGLPGMMMPGVYNNGLQIQQSPGYVAVQKEMIHETRVIPTTPRQRTGIKQWLGSSRGRWDGDTLIIEVTDFNGKYLYRGAGPDLKLTERYRLVDADTLEYTFTLDDPTIWTQPWTGMFHFKRDEAQYELVEYACHEGNYGMRNILSAARAKDQQAASETSGD